MIFTSNFKISGHLPQAVAISLGVPRGWRRRRYTALAPTRKLIKIIDPVTFTQLYKSEVLAKLDPKKVIRDMGGDNFVMLCWEAPREFCHRQVVAAAAFLKLLELARIGLDQMMAVEAEQSGAEHSGEVQSGVA